MNSIQALNVIQNTCTFSNLFYWPNTLTSKRRINHADIPVVFTTSDHVPTLLKLKPKIPSLRRIVNVDKISSDASNLLKEWSHSQGVIFEQLADCGFSYFFRCLFPLISFSWGLWEGQFGWTNPCWPQSNCLDLLHFCMHESHGCSDLHLFCIREPQIIQKVSFSGTKIWLSQCRPIFTALIRLKGHA